MDKILIQDLLVRCIVGVFPEERREKQDVVLNITLFADLSVAGQSDRLDDTVDYKALKKSIIKHVSESSCLLIEALAQQVADICLGDPRVARARVRIDKPGALRFARSVAVEVDRSRANGLPPEVSTA
ncbi:MAG: dihydroneopterin aldolase [Candidatus Pacebacteria bacterium]|nr:dihydroneopterin aldolase [Candidatus Paceibacterota bacterium]